MPPKPQKSEDEKREDEILKRMLNTPPKPHKSKEQASDDKNSKKPRSKRD